MVFYPEIRIGVVLRSGGGEFMEPTILPEPAAGRAAR